MTKLEAAKYKHRLVAFYYLALSIFQISDIRAIPANRAWVKSRQVNVTYTLERKR